MKKQRIRESEIGVQDPVTAGMYDRFARQLRDWGWNGVREMLSAGWEAAPMLELGPVPAMWDWSWPASWVPKVSPAVM